MESNRQTEDAAAAWLLRRDSGRWAGDDESQFKEWIDASLERRVAFLRLEAVWEHAHRLKALGAGIPAGTVPPSGQWNISPLFERREPVAEREPQSRPRGASKPKRLAIAAAVALMLAGGFYFRFFLDKDLYTTPIGGIASIPLRDGSSVTLNTASQIRVVLTPEERLIELQSGEAFFDVAKDPARPFVVQAGNKRIVAVGTRFAVRRDGNDVRVTVTEGKVRFESELLTAGAVAYNSGSETQVEAKALRDAEAAVGWRTGYLTFDNVPLGQAIAELNRYNFRQIEVADAEVAALKVSGKFRPTNLQAFIRVLRDGFDIQAHEADDRVVLTRQ